MRANLSVNVMSIITTEDWKGSALLQLSSEVSRPTSADLAKNNMWLLPICRASPTKARVSNKFGERVGLQFWGYSSFFEFPLEVPSAYYMTDVFLYLDMLCDKKLLRELPENGLGAASCKGGIESETCYGSPSLPVEEFQDRGAPSGGAENEERASRKSSAACSVQFSPCTAAGGSGRKWRWRWQWSSRWWRMFWWRGSQWSWDFWWWGQQWWWACIWEHSLQSAGRTRGMWEVRCQEWTCKSGFTSEFGRWDQDPWTRAGRWWFRQWLCFSCVFDRGWALELLIVEIVSLETVLFWRDHQRNVALEIGWVGGGYSFVSFCARTWLQLNALPRAGMTQRMTIALGWARPMQLMVTAVPRGVLETKLLWWNGGRARSQSAWLTMMRLTSALIQLLTVMSQLCAPYVRNIGRSSSKLPWVCVYSHFHVVLLTPPIYLICETKPIKG